jgi:SAM-dependent methyltransferase
MREQPFESFADFEFAGWERAAGRYDSTWAGLTGLFIEPLLRAAGVSRQMRVLDVACGPGYVARRVGRLGARVTGLDFSPAMVQQARTYNPELEFRVGDAQALPFPEDSFDVVTMSFGRHHLSEPERALVEAARVLREGGRYAFTMWAPPEESPGELLVESAIRAHANLDVPLPVGPDRYGLGTLEEIRTTLERSGFRAESVEVTKIRAEWHVPSPDFLFEAERDVGVRTPGLLAAQTPEVLEAIRRDLARGMEKFRVAEGFAIPHAAQVIVARK